MKFYNKILSLFFITGLLLSQTNFAQDTYQDINEHWAKEVIERWSNSGVIKGSNNEFRPDDKITRAEMMVIVDRLIDFQKKDSNIYSDVENTWYTDAVLKNIHAGIIKGNNNKISPNEKISREEAVVILGRALTIEPSEEHTSFDDDHAISPWALGYVHAFSKAGYIKGCPDNLFAPNKTISRGEIIALIDSLITTYHNQPGTYTHNSDGNVLINTADVTLKDSNIKGNLIITEGVAKGEVYLTQVTVEGDIIVKGGGENSVYFSDVAINGHLVIDKEDGDLRIVASGQTSIPSTILKSGVKLVEKDLTRDGFNNILVPKKFVKASAVTLTGQFDSFKVQSEGLNVKLTSSTVIDRVTIDPSAKGTHLSGGGRAKNLSIDANGVKTSIASNKITVSKDANNVISNGKKIASGSTTTSSGRRESDRESKSSSGSSKKSSSSSSSSSSSHTNQSSEKDHVAVEKVTLNFVGDKLKLAPNSTYQLSAFVAPNNASNKTLSWTVTTEGATRVKAITTSASTTVKPLLTVDKNGKITTSSTLGNGRLTVSSLDKPSVQKTLDIEVTEDAKEFVNIRFYKGELVIEQHQIKKDTTVDEIFHDDIRYWYVKDEIIWPFNFSWKITEDTDFSAKMKLEPEAILSFIKDLSFSNLYVDGNEYTTLKDLAETRNAEIKKMEATLKLLRNNTFTQMDYTDFSSEWSIKHPRIKYRKPVSYINSNGEVREYSYSTYILFTNPPNSMNEDWRYDCFDSDGNMDVKLHIMALYTATIDGNEYVLVGFEDFFANNPDKLGFLLIKDMGNNQYEFTAHTSYGTGTTKVDYSEYGVYGTIIE